jgi:hypothetical protein
MAPVSKPRSCSVELAEHKFQEAMVAASERLKRDIGYNPTRFLRMVGEHGGRDAAKRLLRAAVASEGFSKLWQHGKLEFSVEAFVLLPWFPRLFTDDERNIARRRLEAHNFPVDEFLERARAAPPRWVDDDAE